MPAVYDLGRCPRPPLVRFIRADGSVSGTYALLEGTTQIELPAGAVAVEVCQLPVYPRDYPQGDDPGWLNSFPDGDQMAPGDPGRPHGKRLRRSA